MGTSSQEILIDQQRREKHHWTGRRWFAATVLWELTVRLTVKKENVLKRGKIGHQHALGSWPLAHGIRVVICKGMRHAELSTIKIVKICKVVL